MGKALQEQRPEGGSGRGGPCWTGVGAGSCRELCPALQGAQPGALPGALPGHTDPSAASLQESGEGRQNPGNNPAIAQQHRISRSARPAGPRDGHYGKDTAPGPGMDTAGRTLWVGDSAELPAPPGPGTEAVGQTLWEGHSATRPAPPGPALTCSSAADSAPSAAPLSSWVSLPESIAGARDPVAAAGRRGRVPPQPARPPHPAPRGRSRRQGRLPPLFPASSLLSCPRAEVSAQPPPRGVEPQFPVLAGRHTVRYFVRRELAMDANGSFRNLS